MALRAGVSMGVPLLLVWWVDRLDLALPATFGAFTALYGRVHAHRSRAMMQASAAVVLVASVAAGTALGAAGAGPWVVVAALAAAAVIAMVASLAWAWHPPGVLFPVFALGATASAGVPASEVAHHLVVAVGAATFALVVGALGVFTPARRRPRQPWDAPLHRALRRPGTFEEVVRVTAAVGLAAAAATAGPSTRHRMVRGLHRAVGTIAGVLVAAALLALDLGTLPMIVLVIALQVGAELLVGRNYAIALVLITPLALLMVHLGSPAPVSTLLADRLVDTVLGVAVGLVVVVAGDRWLTRARRAPR